LPPPPPPPTHTHTQAPEGASSDATALAMVHREKSSGEKILEDLKARVRRGGVEG
jgi:hypothetical protein